MPIKLKTLASKYLSWHEVEQQQKIILKLNYYCNNKCEFCHCYDHRLEKNDALLSSLRQKLQLCKQKNISTILFSGGEPTINPDFWKCLQITQLFNFYTGLITHGRSLASNDFVSRLMEHKFVYAYVSLHGSNSEIHDQVVAAPGAFKQTVAGLHNLFKHQVYTIVNFVVTQKNIQDLLSFINLVKAWPLVKIKFSFTEMRGLAEQNGFNTVTDLQRTAGAIQEAMDYGQSVGLAVDYENLPDCYMPGRKKNFDHLQSNNIVYMSELNEKHIYPTTHGNKTFPATCNPCRLRGECPGFNNNLSQLLEQMKVYPRYHDEYAHIASLPS